MSDFSLLQQRSIYTADLSGFFAFSSVEKCWKYIDLIFCGSLLRMWAQVSIDVKFKEPTRCFLTWLFNFPRVSKLFKNVEIVAWNLNNFAIEDCYVNDLKLNCKAASSSSEKVQCNVMYQSGNFFCVKLPYFPQTQCTSALQYYHCWLVERILRILD